jgi:hypothetical protein
LIYSGRNSGGYTTQQTLWQIQSSRYTMADIYTVADIQPDIQNQVRIHIHRGRYTEVIQDTSTIYTAADHSGGYTAADTQWRMNSSRYSSGYTTQ